VLMIRTSHIMDHLSHTNSLRDKWNALPVKSDRVFKKQLHSAGVLLTNSNGEPDDFERTISQKRIAHLSALSMAKLADYALYGVKMDISPDP
jgi:hypothetical protein